MYSTPGWNTMPGSAAAGFSRDRRAWVASDLRILCQQQEHKKPTEIMPLTDRCYASTGSANACERLRERPSR